MIRCISQDKTARKFRVSLFQVGIIDPVLNHGIVIVTFFPVHPLDTISGLNNGYICGDDGMPLYAFKIPSTGHNFAKSPGDHPWRSCDKTEEYKPHLLRTWIETRFVAEDGTIIFTPPYLCNFNRLNFSGPI